MTLSTKSPVTLLTSDFVDQVTGDLAALWYATWIVEKAMGNSKKSRTNRKSHVKFRQSHGNVGKSWILGIKPWKIRKRSCTNRNKSCETRKSHVKPERTKKVEKSGKSTKSPVTWLTKSPKLCLETIIIDLRLSQDLCPSGDTTPFKRQGKLTGKTLATCENEQMQRAT